MPKVVRSGKNAKNRLSARENREAAQRAAIKKRARMVRYRLRMLPNMEEGVDGSK